MQSQADLIGYVSDQGKTVVTYNEELTLKLSDLRIQFNAETE